MMKSQSVIEAPYLTDADKARYSDLKVLLSAAGFYVGTTYHDKAGIEMPGTRDSGYFPTQEMAAHHLAKMEQEERNAVLGQVAAAHRLAA